MSQFQNHHLIVSAVGEVQNSVALSLNWLLFGIITLLLLVLIVGLVFISVRAYRSETSELPLPPLADDDNRTVTLAFIAGVAIPITILAIILVLMTLDDVNGVGATNEDQLTIEVIGHRWWWEVRYPAYDIVTANEIMIPVGKPVNLKLTSQDVIHSFWIPQLGVQLGMIPGRTEFGLLSAPEQGSYRGQCGEYCGLQHARMAFYVKAISEDEFDNWLVRQQQPAQQPQTELVEQGLQVFTEVGCTDCHRIEGTHATGVTGPDLTHFASRETIGAGATDNNKGNLAGWIINAQAIKPGSLMPPMDIESEQLEPLLAYLMTLE